MADIELVIKIPEEVKQTFDNAKNEDLYANYYDRNSLIGKVIQNGIALPKGHGRLIDADKTISKICGSSCGCHLEECGHDEPCFSVTRIESAPTIIEADKERSDKE